MKLDKLSLALPAAALAIALAFASSVSHAGLFLRIDPPTTNAELADSVQFDVVADATLGDQFIGIGLDVLFDAAILGYDGITFNPAFTGVATLNDSIAGTLKLDALVGFDPVSSTIPPLSGTDIRIATVRMTALAVGTSPLDFAFPDLGTLDGFIQPIPPGGVVGADATVGGQVQVTVTETPIPAPLALMLPGLVLLRRCTIR